jgi:hypothetical protein
VLRALIHRHVIDGRWIEDDHDAGLAVIESADTRNLRRLIWRCV